MRPSLQRAIRVSGLSIAAIWWLACSAGGGGASPGGSSTGGSSGSSGAGGTAGSSEPDASVGGAGGAAGTAGAGGVFDTGTGETGLDPDAACVGISEAAQNKIMPADILFALDNSGSMDAESVFVQLNMNIFSYGIPPQIDPHVVVLSADSAGTNGVCIDPPLGSGSCPNDSNPPMFLHIPQDVQSSNSLDLILQLFDQYESSFRVQSVKHVVVVTDDNASMEAAAFDQQFRARLQDFGAAPEYTFHGIFAFTNPFPFTCMNNPGADPCCAPAPELVYSADIGEEYAKLVMMTGGVAGNLCLQDFAPIFNAVTEAVLQSTKLACEWDIPAPPDGGVVDPNLVNVAYSTGGGSPVPIGYVNSPQDCAAVEHGWYFDDPANPTRVLVCPETCAMLQASPDAGISIEFGCLRKPAVPK